MMKKCSKCGEEKPLDATNFRQAKNKKGEAGYRAQCRVCGRERCKEWRKTNQEATREYQRRYCEKNRQAIRERSRKWYGANLEARRQWSRKWHKANPEARKRWYWEQPEEKRAIERASAAAAYWRDPEQCRESAKRWREANPDRVQGKHQRWRERYANDPIFRQQYLEKQRLWMKLHPEMGRAGAARRRARKKAGGGNVTAAQLRAIRDQQRNICYWCRQPVAEKGHFDHVIPLSRGGTHDAANIVWSCASCNLRKNDKLPEEWAGRLL